MKDWMGEDIGIIDFNIVWDYLMYVRFWSIVDKGCLIQVDVRGWYLRDFFLVFLKGC